MEGIYILNKTLITDTPIWACILGFLTMILSILFIIVTMVMFVEEFGYLKVVICLYCALLSLIMLVRCTQYIDSINTGRYRYEVTIDDTVSFTELQEKYDVIEQNGKIWTLEDKEVKEK